MSEKAATSSAMNLEQQADYLMSLASRCTMSGGETAGETHLLLTADDAREIEALAGRLYRMAPFERDIRGLVSRR
jgi:hypothetical protein